MDLVAEYRQDVEYLFALQNELRTKAIPNAPALDPRPELLGIIAERLNEKYTVADCEKALRFRASQAAAGTDEDAIRRFDGLQNWHPRALHYAVSQPPAVAVTRTRGSAPAAPASKFSGTRRIT